MLWFVLRSYRSWRGGLAPWATAFAMIVPCARAFPVDDLSPHSQMTETKGLWPEDADRIQIEASAEDLAPAVPLHKTQYFDEDNGTGLFDGGIENAGLADGGSSG